MSWKIQEKDQNKRYEDYNNTQNVRIYHAGIEKDSKGNFITAGGRVLNMVCKDKNIKKALTLTYDICKSFVERLFL